MTPEEQNELLAENDRLRRIIAAAHETLDALGVSSEGAWRLDKRLAAGFAAARAEGREQAAQVARKYRNTYGGEFADYYAGMDAAAAAIEDEIRALTVQV